jgi:hypothetical protein
MDYKLELVIIPVTDVDRCQRSADAIRRNGPWAAARRLTAVPHRNTDEFSLRHSFYLQDAIERGC